MIGLNKRQLYVFAGAGGWRCVLKDNKGRARGVDFNSGPEEHIRSFLRDFRVKKAFIIISSEKTVLRFAKLPLIKTREINKAISFLYEENFPLDKDKYIFGYTILSKISDQYSLLLAALPSETVSGLINLFGNMGITIETLGLFEGIGGLCLSEFISILVFIKQETSWRVIWMKNKTPIDTWRVTGTNDINSLFAELDFGEAIENAVFYSSPEKWLTEACEEHGLSVSEALDIDDIFDGCGLSVNMLPEAYKRGSLHKYIIAFAAAFFTILAVALGSSAVWLNARADMLQARAEGLSAQIRLLSDEINNQPGELPAELISGSSAYGRALKILTGRLPAGARIRHISASDNILGLTVNSGGSDWLNGYIEECQSRLSLRILTSGISKGEGVTEIELLIEMR